MSRVLPILFNTEMVRAILDGRKTVTRRIVPGNIILNSEMDHKVTFFPYKPRKDKGHVIKSIKYFDLKSFAKYESTYHSEDILYVRETWCNLNTLSCPCYYYKASDNLPEWALGSWKPSIHMPKEVARIWLKVTDVRVERLHDMTPDDCSEEGIRFYDCPAGFTWKSNTDMKNCYIEAVGAMKALWNSTVKKTDLYLYGWDTNPWVWVIEFERCEKPDIGGNYVAV